MVPKATRRDVLEQVRTSPLARHPGIQRTLDLVGLRFWWPDLAKDVAQFVRDYRDCARCKASRVPKAGRYSTVRISTPSKRAATDFIGPLSKTANGNEYIQTFQDYGNKYLVTKVEKKFGGEIVANNYPNEIVYKFGAAEGLLSDNGSPFTAEITNWWT